MNSIIARLKTAAEKRAEFNRTYHELRYMPRETAIDLGMFPEDAYDVAYAHVYGR
ncbi:hypothetical protein [Roseobacter sinensis]|uniref:DUF1127 domain-containing protein n=1 Tax=Roseobacter sinensis TaxID=2931391 RepID=A0ABT3BHC3_9RHOB|nr:hypothetical protein [Roseobacter sp. WL0113]MCV3272977.1 hypothetical protein [Roseobacter sp. WL0113]